MIGSGKGHSRRHVAPFAAVAAVAVVAVVAVVALAGYGGSSKSSSTKSATTTSPPSNSGSTPQPKETIQQFAQRMTGAYRAAVSGDCATVRSFSAKASITPFCGDARAKADYKNFKVTGAQAFGTGGVIDFTDAALPRGATTIVVLNDDGKYYPLVTVALTSTPTVNGVKLAPRQVGTSPVNVPAQTSAAQAFVDAVRKNDCATLLKIWLKANTGTRYTKQQCANAFTIIRSDELAAPQARPVPLGGVQVALFFRLVTGRRYRTMVTMPARSGGYLVDAYRSDTQGAAG